jgi:hypothetical protein
MCKTRRAWSLAVLLVALGGLCAATPQLSEVKTVYLWPMPSSFDQYLAQQIISAGIFEVVVDPKLATAVMTERIDAPFLKAMDTLFPRPQPAAEKPEEDKEKVSGGLEGTEERPVNRALGSPQGTVFLVDVQTRKVLWSTFLKKDDYSPDKLNKQARTVVDELKKRLNPGS